MCDGLQCTVLGETGKAASQAFSVGFTSLMEPHMRQKVHRWKAVVWKVTQIKKNQYLTFYCL